jgi:nitroreductase
METTTATLHPLLADRWSTRAFDPGHALSPGQLDALLDAARWAPSAGNSQPWRFGVALRGTAEFEALGAALDPGNAVWAPSASALLLVATTATGPDGAERPWADYDAGQAAAHLSLQAQAEGLSVHQMGGFDQAAAARVFALPVGTRPLVVMAVGRHEPAADLPESYAERERLPRTRLGSDDILLAPTATALPRSA